MKTIIIYATKHGTTKKISELIATELKGHDKDNEDKNDTTDKNSSIDVIDIKKIKEYNIRVFDRIIIGGSIHAGQIQGSIKKFCEENKDALKEKKLGLFISCMIDDESKRAEQLNNAFPKELIAHSSAASVLGGEFLFEKMNFIEKLMVKIIAKTKKTKSNINYEEIKKFSDKMKK